MRQSGVCLIALMVGSMAKDILACSVFCEDGKIPCGGYGATCEGFKGCTYPDECQSR